MTSPGTGAAPRPASGHRHRTTRHGEHRYCRRSDDSVQVLGRSNSVRPSSRARWRVAQSLDVRPSGGASASTPCRRYRHCVGERNRKFRRPEAMRIAQEISNRLLTRVAPHVWARRATRSRPAIPRHSPKHCTSPASRVESLWRNASIPCEFRNRRRLGEPNA